MSLDVFLVPVAETRHELYTEHEHEEDASPAPHPDTVAAWWPRQVARFKATLAEAEEERRRRDRGEPEQEGGSLWRALWRALMRRIAETIAEQRLLWQLRGKAQARLLHPELMAPDQALDLMRASISKDLAKHRLWCVIDAALTAVLGPLLFLVPGPNFVSWYFFVRAIGHWLSLRGATHGLKVTVWQTQPSRDLAAVRAALALPRAERHARLDAIAAALGLKHLTGFVLRVSARPR